MHAQLLLQALDRRAGAYEKNPRQQTHKHRAAHAKDRANVMCAE